MSESKFRCRAFSHGTLASVLRRSHATCGRISPATYSGITADTAITGMSTYVIISTKAAPIGLTTYVIPCFWHSAITSFCILYRLCRGIIGNRLRRRRRRVSDRCFTLTNILMFNLKVQMSSEPVVEIRFLDIARRFQLHSKPARFLIVLGHVHNHVIRLRHNNYANRDTGAGSVFTVVTYRTMCPRTL